MVVLLIEIEPCDVPLLLKSAIVPSDLPLFIKKQVPASTAQRSWPPCVFTDCGIDASLCVAKELEVYKKQTLS